MSEIDRVFDNLDDWRHLSAYQLERRADIFFSIFLPQLLEACYGFEIEGLVPEFPLRIGTIDPQSDSNRCVKVDYVAKAKGSKINSVPASLRDSSVIISDSSEERLRTVHQV